MKVPSVEIGNIVPVAIGSVHVNRNGGNKTRRRNALSSALLLNTVCMLK